MALSYFQNYVFEQIKQGKLIDNSDKKHATALAKKGLITIQKVKKPYYNDAGEIYLYCYPYKCSVVSN